MLCILCSGQGDQQAGMFARLRRDPAAAEVLDRAVRDKWLADDVAAWLAAPPPDDAALHIDRYAQPLVCLYQQAAWAAVAPRIGPVSLFAGLSVGELSAAACAGMLDTPGVLRVAARRAELMDTVAPPGGLVAVRGLDRDAIDALCNDRQAAIAIQFAADHWTLGCLAPQCAVLVAAARERGATLAVALDVTIASHTPWMSPAAPPLRACLESVKLMRPRVPLLAGTTAQRILAPAMFIGAVCDQLHTTIRWDLCIEAALSCGTRTFLELGPGSTLARTILARDPTIAARSIDEFSSLSDAAIWAVRQGQRPYLNRRGWPVDSRTLIHRSPSGSTVLRSRMARVMGTWTKRPCQRPTTISVRPLIAACTALWASRRQ